MKNNKMTLLVTTKQMFLIETIKKLIISFVLAYTICVLISLSTVEYKSYVRYSSGEYIDIFGNRGNEDFQYFLYFVGNGKYFFPILISIFLIIFFILMMIMIRKRLRVEVIATQNSCEEYRHRKEEYTTGYNGGHNNHNNEM